MSLPDYMLDPPDDEEDYEEFEPDPDFEPGGACYDEETVRKYQDHPPLHLEKEHA